MNNSPNVIFLAPGAGLGHLTRANAIAIELRKSNISSLIITSSKYAKPLYNFTKIDTFFLPISLWEQNIKKTLIMHKSQLIIQDSFPFGFRGENLSDIAEKTPFLYLARYIEIEKYLKINKRTWDINNPCLKNVLIIEKLSDEHLNLIIKTKSNILTINNMIKFPLDEISQNIPKIPQNSHLIIHSGPQKETDILLDLAEKNIKKDEIGKIIKIQPNNNQLDFFPAALLFEQAYKIYTGAGYNSIAETNQYIKKHIAVPFIRKYDNQNFRLKNRNKSQNDNKQAIKFIQDLINRNL